LLHPDERWIAVALVLDHETADREHMHFAIGWITEFQRQKFIKDPLAGYISIRCSTTLGTFINHTAFLINSWSMD
jgi:hypothetical protein